MRHSASAEDNPQVGRYVAIVSHYKWLLIVSAVTCWIVGLAVSLILPAKYRSETVILVEQPKVLTQYVPPNVAIDLQQRLQSLTQQILSRTRLTQIIDRFGLYGKKPGETVSDDLLQRMRNDIIIDQTKTSSHGDELSAFKVSYSAPKAALARDVVGQITTLFIDANVHNQQQMSEETTAFLDNQLNEARKDLENQEKLLGAFRSRYLGELPEQLTSNVQILSGLQTRLQSATSGLHQAEQQKLYLVSMIGQSKADQPVSEEDGPAPDALARQIAKMKTDLADLTARYTPEHPDVIRLREQIAQAEALQGRASPSPAGDRSARSPSDRRRIDAAHSSLAQLESQLKANELEIANRKQEVEALEKEIGQYQGRLNLTPIREQQLADVSRNHEQSRANYESLLAKRLQSGMATDLAKRQEGEQFSILDPPSLPQKPYSPNPLLLSLAGLVLGLVGGLAFIFAKETFQPHLYTEAEIPQYVEVPVIATIPPLLTWSERNQELRQRNLGLAATIGLSMIVPLLTLIAYLRR
jgi:polysaccharide chain length determinant protein (PEP-CTERM system associated)